MFSSNGNWKEFGIGRSRERYTWLPFWLFAIVWAIMSYMIVLVIIDNRTNINNYDNNGAYYVNDYNANLQAMNSSQMNLPQAMNLPHAMNLPQPMNLHQMNSHQMNYNTNASENSEGFYLIHNRNGMPPQKIYLGPKAPAIHYDNM